MDLESTRHCGKRYVFWRLSRVARARHITWSWDCLTTSGNLFNYLGVYKKMALRKRFSGKTKARQDHLQLALSLTGDVIPTVTQIFAINTAIQEQRSSFLGRSCLLAQRIAELTRAIRRWRCRWSHGRDWFTFFFLPSSIKNLSQLFCLWPIVINCRLKVENTEKEIMPLHFEDCPKAFHYLIPLHVRACQSATFQ